MTIVTKGATRPGFPEKEWASTVQTPWTEHTGGRSASAAEAQSGSVSKALQGECSWCLAYGGSMARQDHLGL